MANDTGQAPKELAIATLCGWPDDLAGGGFCVSAEIPMVRHGRGRPLDHESRCRRAFFARHPQCFALVICLLLPHLFWCANYAANTSERVRDEAVDPEWR